MDQDILEHLLKEVRSVSANTAEIRADVARLDERLAGAIHAIGARADKNSQNVRRIEEDARKRVASVERNSELRDERIMGELVQLTASIRELQNAKLAVTHTWRGVVLASSVIGAVLGGGVPFLLHLLGIVKIVKGG